MNKALTIIITIILTAAVSSTATYVVVTKVLPEDKETTVAVNNDNGSTQNNQNIDSEKAELIGGEQTKTGANTHGFDVDIKSTRLTQTESGKPAIIVTYILTNPSTSDEEANFLYDFDHYAYQNGVELENYHYDMIEGDPYNDYYDLDDSYVKPGFNVEIQEAYVLTDTASVVVAEIKEDLWNSNKLFVSRTFKFN